MFALIEYRCAAVKLLIFFVPENNSNIGLISPNLISAMHWPAGYLGHTVCCHKPYCLSHQRVPRLARPENAGPER